MNARLLHPPFADPTQPYLSLPYLKGYLSSKGLRAEVIDLNLAAARHLLDPHRVKESARQLADRFERLNGRTSLSGLEQMEYLALAEARPSAARGMKAAGSAVETFQDRERFYDPRAYRRARDQAEDTLAVFGAISFPYQFHFNRAAHVAAPWDLALLEKYCRQAHSPLDDFYRARLTDWRLAPGDVVGISLTFVSQISESFYLLHLIREVAPFVFTIVGGSCIQQILRHASESVTRRLLQWVDAFCLFEGEETLVQLLRAVNSAPRDEAPAERFERLSAIPNLLLRHPSTGAPHRGPMQVSDLTRCPPPDYSDLNLDGYLAPSRTLLFAPTRGCYWNRCSFCDYGLNRSGCHSYREMAPQEAARQLTDLSRVYGVKNFYLSVDVLAPKFAVALAEALIALKADICWSADFRIEPYYTPERCAVLFRSGLRAVAFGVESGSDDLLRRMHKGITVEQIRRVNAAFHKAGIATAWMTFSGHPGETATQMRATLRLIKIQQDQVDLFILGRFGLTGGSDIAACPEKYGLTRVFYCRGDDLRLFPLYEIQGPAPEGVAGFETEVLRLSADYRLDYYPWAGAISTHHTLLYFEKYGPGIFRSLAGERLQQPKVVRDPRLPKGMTMAPAFSLKRMRASHARFMAKFWQKALKANADGTAPLDEAYFLSAVEKRAVVKRSAES
jgi:hypothetical protein